MKVEASQIRPAAIRRVLVTKLRHHGDVLLTTPVLASLKRQLPWAEIDALIYHETRDMLADNPYLDQLHTIQRTRAVGGTWAKLRHELSLFRTLRSRRYDLVLHLTEHNRGATLVRALKPRWSVSLDGPWHGFFKRSFSHLYLPLWGNRRHTVEMNLDALRVIGLYPDEADKHLSLIPGEAATHRCRAELAAAGLAPQGYLLLHPGSRWAYKVWPAERMADLIGRLLAAGHKIVLTGSPDQAEREMADTILAQLGAGREQVLNRVGQLNLRELAAYIADARMLIGVDSVPMHMAAALDTPIVALFGPSNPVEWGPWRVPHRLVSAALPCLPCGMKGCGNSGYSECLANLPADTVMAAVQDLLRATENG
ncbi:putative lipopolysaccharide heptosyltransferase III [Chitinimonas arctica]|uniref:Putative lipopolysaccharide heptosyltransferase III n=1 Tax=Chitinimonas arctica TaxID=2594795 RepID=A0A516SGL5_9NEIS|nr:putative lipopolysaccharide heptosyltransferase III [Chitinimonas arctica]QDQ27272.1 putative lipopolysaccharide heptosyltransferase III [Chitinimonas arctica]